MLLALMLGACADVESDESAGMVGQSLSEDEAAYEDDAGARDTAEASGALVINPVFPDTVFTGLDYGLYWYGYDAGSAEGRYVKADQAGNPFYDPSRPTVIHIHGWQKNSIAEFSREDYDHRRGSDARKKVAKDIAKPWLDQGYNVGMLYWTNFADEVNVTDAEAKIWPRPANSKTGIKYKVCKTPVKNCATQQTMLANPTDYVAKLLADSIVAGMANFEGDSFRLTGHSLGNQLAIAIADEIYKLIKNGIVSNDKLLPTRIALLDPYYSGAKTTNLAAAIVATLKADTQVGAAPVVFEVYRSSALAAQNSSLIVKKGNAALVSLRPSYYGTTELAPKHQVGYWWYFWGKEFAVPSISGSTVRGLSASASDEEVRQYMDSAQYLDQVQDLAAKTMSPSDDVFKLQSR